MTFPLPAWSEAFAADARAGLARADTPFGRLDRDAVFGDADGRGVTVAIIDSGVDGEHPAVRGRVARHLRVDLDGDAAHVVDDPEARDLVGHGTACAGIVASIATAATIVSIRMLGADNRGKGRALAAAVEWAVAERIAVVNLSLSSRSEAMFSSFHALADRSYFANTLLVCAANNIPGPSYPSLFAAVLSVAAHDVAGPGHLVLQPVAPGRIRRIRRRCRGRVAGWRADPGDRQLVRGAAPGRPGRPSAVALPGGHAVRDQGPARGDRQRTCLKSMTARRGRAVERLRRGAMS